jgi:hypothetical protein
MKDLCRVGDLFFQERLVFYTTRSVKIKISAVQLFLTLHRSRQDTSINTYKDKTSKSNYSLRIISIFSVSK